VNPLLFSIKMVVLLCVIALMQSTLTRLRIDQTVGLWWQAGAILSLAQLLIIILVRVR
jgi:NADH:ubiquinone oxidoreductase subunit H